MVPHDGGPYFGPGMCNPTSLSVGGLHAEAAVVSDYLVVDKVLPGWVAWWWVDEGGGRSGRAALALDTVVAESCSGWLSADGYCTWFDGAEPCRW